MKVKEDPFESKSINIIMSELIKSVWYLPSENTWKDFNFMAMKDIGILTLKNGELNFKGKSYDIVIENIKTVSFGKQGRDFINNWVKLEFRTSTGKIETAFFADGKMAGWSGIFGGTKSIFKKIRLKYN